MPEVPRSLAAIEQAARLAGPDSTIQAMAELAGGTHARTTLIRTANPETEVILREFLPGDDTAGIETKVLQALDGLDGLAPRQLASDLSHVASRGSWLLISRLPGSADITPRHPAAHADQLGKALARIHQTPLPRLAGLPAAFDHPEDARTALSGPAASRHPASTPAGAAWTSGCSTARPSPIPSSMPTTRREDRRCPIRCYGTCGPSPDRTRWSRPGPRTTSTSAAPT